MKDLDSTEKKEQIVLLSKDNTIVDNASENQPIRLHEISDKDKLKLERKSADQKNGSHNLTQLYNFRTHHK